MYRGGVQWYITHDEVSHVGSLWQKESVLMLNRSVTMVGGEKEEVARGQVAA